MVSPVFFGCCTVALLQPTSNARFSATTRIAFIARSVALRAETDHAREQSTCGALLERADIAPMDADSRFADLDLQLPPAPKPVGIYKPMVVVGSLAYLSGHGPLCPDKSLMTGKVGAQLTPEQGKLAARQAGLALLATLKAQLGSLNKVSRVVKVLGMVNAAPDFEAHPSIINGASELFASVWGPDAGVGARSAVGMASLPSNIAVEIEMIVELMP